MFIVIIAKHGHMGALPCQVYTERQKKLPHAKFPKLIKYNSTIFSCTPNKDI